MLSKADRIDDERRAELAHRHRDGVLVSAVTGEGIEALVERIEEEFARSLRDVELLIPYDEGGRLAELHELAGDLEREETPDGVRVVARLPASLAGRYQPFALSGRRDEPARRAARRARACCRPVLTRATRASTCTRSTTPCSGPGSGPASAQASRSRSPRARRASVLPRSGLAARHGIALVNAPGLIDAGYRGEVQVLLLNTDARRRSRSPRATGSRSWCSSACRRRRSSRSRSWRCPSAAPVALARAAADAAHCASAGCLSSPWAAGTCARPPPDPGVRVDGGVEPRIVAMRQQRADLVDRRGEHRSLASSSLGETTGTTLPQPNTWRGSLRSP